MTSGLTIHVGEDLVSLARQLAELLAHDESPVLAPTWLVVPSSAVRQWLDVQLSQHWAEEGEFRTDGVSANLHYLFPEEFVRTVESAALATRGRSRTNWDVATLSLAQLARLRPRPTYERAQRQSEAIDLLLRWRSDQLRQIEIGTNASRDAVSIFEHVTRSTFGPLEQRDAVNDVIAQQRPAELPERMYIFGLASVPGGPQFVELVSNLSRHVEIHVLCPTVNLSRARAQSELRANESPTPLSSWFREADESLQLWQRADPMWRFLEPSSHQLNTLGTFQQFLRRGDIETASQLDGSVRIVSAVGRSRQIEVVRDLVLDAVSDGIAPHDILILCPDPSAISRDLERHWNHDYDSHERAPRLAYELTEDSSSNDASRLSSSIALLHLLGNYVTREQLETFCSFPSVRKRLDLTGGQLDRLWQLASAAPVTFGVSAQQRSSLDVVYDADDEFRLDAGTWERLSDRVTRSSIDVWMGDDLALGVPDDLSILARIQPLLRLLEVASPLRFASATQPLSDWVSNLQQWMSVVSESDVDDSFERAQRTLITRIEHADGHDSLDVAMSYEEFTALWADLASSGTRQRVFGRRGVVVAPLTSLHFAPFDMICIVGFDDDLLPGASWSHPLLGERRLGDPDPRHAVLASTLAACASARERLVITYSGRDDASGRTIEPTIALNELREVLSCVVGENFIIESSSRHGFAVPANDPHAITTTYDSRYLQRHVVARSRPVVDDADRATRDELLEFLARPATYYLRRTLRADIPEDPMSDPAVPPIAVDARHRARLQRDYTHRLAQQLHADFDASDTIPTFSHFAHDASERCVDLECAWIHVPAARLQRDVFFNEAAIGAVPPRLWHHRLQLSLLHLAAYNFAVDLSDVELKLNSTLDEDLELTNDFVITSSQATRERRSSTLMARSRDTDHLMYLDFAVRTRGTTEPRDVLRQSAELMLLQAQGSTSSTLATTYFLPERAQAYDKKQGDVLAGDFARNPYVSLRYLGTADDARNDLAIFVELLRRARREPVALFPRTSVAFLRGGHKLARSTWEDGFSAPGECSQGPHRLLFPSSYDDLVALHETEAFPFARELRLALQRVEIATASQTKRPPAQRWRESHPQLWSGSEIEATFTSLIPNDAGRS